MRRELIKEVMDQADIVQKALEALPYRDAVPALRALDEIRCCVSEELPGHEYAECPFCEEPKGIDEMEIVGDESACTECIKKWSEASTLPTANSE